MKGSDIFYEVVGRCLEFNMDVRTFAQLLHSAVLCMAQTPLATDHNIYCKYFEREAVRLGMGIMDRQQADDQGTGLQPCAFLAPPAFYLPEGTGVLNAHIQAYKKLIKIVPELWAMYELKAGGRELTKIVTFLMGDIIESVRQLHAKHN